MKKILLSVLGTTLLISCTNSNEEGNRTNLDWNHNVYTDPDTGVMYLEYSGGHGVSITPMYNADGSLKVKADESKR